MGNLRNRKKSRKNRKQVKMSRGTRDLTASNIVPVDDALLPEKETRDIRLDEMTGTQLEDYAKKRIAGHLN